MDVTFIKHVILFVFIHCTKPKERIKRIIIIIIIIIIITLKIRWVITKYHNNNTIALSLEEKTSKHPKMLVSL